MARAFSDPAMKMDSSDKLKMIKIDASNPEPLIHAELINSTLTSRCRHNACQSYHASAVKSRPKMRENRTSNI